MVFGSHFSRLSASIQQQKSKFSSLLTKKVTGKDVKWEKWWEGSISNHPGSCRIPATVMPEAFDKNATVYLQPADGKKISMTMTKFCDNLYHRQLATYDHVPYKSGSRSNFSRELKNFKKGIEEINTKSKEWRSILYDEFMVSMYLVARTPASYASALRVLNEIKQFNKSFEPKDLLDVGSGTGSTVWAANQLWPNLKQFYCVEKSEEMSKLAHFLLGQNCSETSDYMEVFIRQNFKAYYQPSYDIVNCAYTLSDLSTKTNRVDLIKKMWGLTNKFLVLIESGNKTGYSLIMEARSMLVKERNAKIFAPCPHEKECPMTKISKNCAFYQKYYIPKYAKRFHPKSANVSLEKFTYIVFEKCNDDEIPVLRPKWPRVIDSHHKHGQCITCHLCSADGELEHLEINKNRDGTNVTQLGRKADTGDLLPLTKFKI